MDGPEQRRTSGGERDEVPLVTGAGGRLLGGLDHPRRERCPGDGVRESGQPPGLPGLRAQQPAHESGVETVHGGKRLVEPVDGVDQQIRTHQAATAPAVGNHCISGNGAVLAGSSR